MRYGRAQWPNYYAPTNESTTAPGHLRRRAYYGRAVAGRHTQTNRATATGHVRWRVHYGRAQGLEYARGSVR
ncbi:hypothetical protein GCM10025331_17250 [Actinoplanes utahensis]|nr:hypothetical protein Aut01nite_24450 [Actinoplanes utahensis]